MNKKNIGKNIQTLRDKAGMTQEELAESTGVPIDCIKNTEAGSEDPSLSLLLDMCSALNTTPNHILAGAYPANCPVESCPFLPAGQNECENFYKGIKEDDVMVLKSMHHFMANRK